MTCRETGLSYVGQSVDIQKRLNQHFTGKGKHLIARIIKTYGKDSFDTLTIEYPNASPQALNAIEKWYIHKHNTLTPNGYNLTEGGDTNPMDNPAVKAHHKRVSGKKTAEMNKRPENVEKNRKRLKERNNRNWQDPEYREKMSKSTSEYNKKRWQDPEYRKRMSERMKGENNPMRQKKQRDASQDLQLKLPL